MGGKGSGNPKPAANESRNPRNIDRDANHWSIELGREMIGWDPPDYADAESVRQRFFDFLDACERCSMRPLMTGWSMALGLDRREVLLVSKGDEYACKRVGVTPESQFAFKKSYEFLQLSWEAQLTSEKNNPVKWLFLGKNYYGYTDTTERVTRHIDETPRLADPEEVKARYLAKVGKVAESLPEAEVIEVEDADSGSDS